jgi:hypothetical protein
MSEKAKKNSITEAIEGLTGYEEQAIENHFGADVVSLLDISVTKACRSLIYAEATRTADHENAWKKAMSLTVKEVSERFSPEEPDTDLPGDEPTTEQGKGDAAGV